MSARATPPSTGSAPSRPKRNQRACDACRGRKIGCRYSRDSSICDGCKFLAITCTQERPRRRRGPANRYARDHARAAAPDSPGLPSVSGHSSPAGPAATSPLLQVASPSLCSARSGSTISHRSYDAALEALGPEPLIDQLLNDWFELIHPLAPVLHRRRFLQRLHRHEAAYNPVFAGLVISVCAATVSTLRRKTFEDYGYVSVERCEQLIETHNLLTNAGAYTLDWCVAKYNMSSALAAVVGMQDPRAFRSGAEAMAGIRYLLHYEFDGFQLIDQEFLKRLYWLLAIWEIGTDLFGQPSLGFLSRQDNLTQLRPRPLSDRELDPEPALATECPPWHGDDTTYVPGLNAVVDIFLAWHFAGTDRIHRTPQDTLARALHRIQETLDNLPRELRWRGGLSRPPGATWGHDIQIANILITSLYMRSNLLQHFGKWSDTDHQTIVNDLLEILSQSPRSVFEANGFSLIPKIRDIGAAYLDELKVGPSGVVVDEASKSKVEKLLKQLEALDFNPGMEFNAGQIWGTSPESG